MSTATPPLSPLDPTKQTASSSRATPKTPHEQLVDQTQKWVSQTFYGTLLKHMHDSPFKSKMMDGGRGGQMFSTLLDQHLADHMGRASGSKLVNAVVRRIEANKAYKQAGQKPHKQAAPPFSVPRTAQTAHRRHGHQNRAHHHSMMGHPSHLIAALTQQGGA